MTVRLDRERIGIPRTRRTAFASRRGRHVLGPHATVARAPTRHHAANTTTGQEKIGDAVVYVTEVKPDDKHDERSKDC
jgi:hypothetical protein